MRISDWSSDVCSSDLRALNEALHQEMAADSSVVVLGEDLAKIGGVWSTTVGLLAAFGQDRVRDTPISESGFIGAAVGMADVGLRPVVELMFVDFFGVCMNSIYSLAAKQRFFPGGQVKCPMVLMTSVGGGYRSEEHTSELQSLMRISYAVFCLKKKNKSNSYNKRTIQTQATLQHIH